MNEYCEEDEANPQIEFVKVEPCYFENDVFNDTNVEDSNEIRRTIKLSSKVQARSNTNAVRKKIIHVRPVYTSKNNHVSTNRKFMPTVRAYNADIVKRAKKPLIPITQYQNIALIKEIKKESCIWDSKHVHYRNQGIRDIVWNRVAARTGFPKEIVKAKWKSTLSSFRKYTLIFKKGQGWENKPRWYAYDLLSFLSNKVEESSQPQDLELPLVCADAANEQYESPERPSNAEEYTVPHLRQGTVEYLEEALLLPETTSAIANGTTENSVRNDDCETSCNEEILRIVRSMSKVLNKMANIGMPVDYGRYVNQHLKGYDEEIRRKTVKGIVDLIMAADEEMSIKYPERSQIPDVNVASSHKK